jgi:hypothetical protein
MKRYLLTVLLVGAALASTALTKCPPPGPMRMPHSVPMMPGPELLQGDEASEAGFGPEEAPMPNVRGDLCQAFAKTLGGAILPKKLTGGVCTVAKPRKAHFTIEGIPTKSPLVNTALFTFEKGPDGKFLNLGEAGLLNQEVAPLRDALEEQGIGITAIHTHWLDINPNVMYMHWMSVEHPLKFAQKTARAWKATIKA